MDISFKNYSMLKVYKGLDRNIKHMLVDCSSTISMF